MEVRLSRRRMMQGVAGAAMAQSLAVEEAAAAPAQRASGRLKKAQIRPISALASPATAADPYPPACSPPQRQPLQPVDAEPEAYSAAATAASCHPNRKPLWRPTPRQVADAAAAISPLATSASNNWAWVI